MSPRFPTFALAGSVLAVLILSGGANAQPAPDLAESIPHETVLVYAPYVVTRTVINPMMSRTSSTGIELVSVSRTVNFGDLNLAKPADATTLENRVREAAKGACEDIERLYPKAQYRPHPREPGLRRQCPQAGHGPRETGRSCRRDLLRGLWRSIAEGEVVRGPGSEQCVHFGRRAMTDQEFPRNEKGYFHLTPEGWVRQDRFPFPANRCETWLYEMEWPHEDAKEQVTLTKVWTSAPPDAVTTNLLRSRFGDPVAPTPERNVKLECRV
jgi:UrcA family protein